MIDTTATAKKTPLLKLGKKKLGGNRGTTDEVPEELIKRALPFCPFKECGRKFISDDELRTHMQRRHRPPDAVSTEESSVKSKSEEPLQPKSTPMPTRSKITGTEILEITHTRSPPKD